jgi:hypothetical protein
VTVASGVVTVLAGVSSGTLGSTPAYWAIAPALITAPDSVQV